MAARQGVEACCHGSPTLRERPTWLWPGSPTAGLRACAWAGHPRVVNLLVAVAARPGHVLHHRLCGEQPGPAMLAPRCRHVAQRMQQAPFLHTGHPQNCRPLAQRADRLCRGEGLGNMPTRATQLGLPRASMHPMLRPIHAAGPPHAVAVRYAQSPPTIAFCSRASLLLELLLLRLLRLLLLLVFRSLVREARLHLGLLGLEIRSLLGCRPKSSSAESAAAPPPS